MRCRTSTTNCLPGLPQDCTPDRVHRDSFPVPRSLGLPASVSGPPRSRNGPVALGKLGHCSTSLTGISLAAALVHDGNGPAFRGSVLRSTPVDHPSERGYAANRRRARAFWRRGPAPTRVSPVMAGIAHVPPIARHGRSHRCILGCRGCSGTVPSRYDCSYPGRGRRRGGWSPDGQTVQNSSVPTQSSWFMPDSFSGHGKPRGVGVDIQPFSLPGLGIMGWSGHLRRRTLEPEATIAIIKVQQN